MRFMQCYRMRPSHNYESNLIQSCNILEKTLKSLNLLLIHEILKTSLTHYFWQTHKHTDGRTDGRTLPSELSPSLRGR